MSIRHSRLAMLASLTVAVMAADRALGQNATWNGGTGNFTDDNWTGGAGVNGAPAAGENVIIPSGSVTLNSDQAALGAYGNLQIGDATLTLTTGGTATFANEVFLGTPDNAAATLIMEGDSVFSGGSFRWAANAGSTGDVIIRDSASFFTTGTQDIIGFSSAVGAGTWTTEGSNVTIQSDDDIWIGDDDVWIANINDPNSFSTAFADDAFGFVGNGSVQVNLSGFPQELGQRWRLIESHGETTQGPIANGPLPFSFTVTGLQPGYGMQILSEEVNETLGFLDVEILNVLNLRVDTTTGNAFLENIAPGPPLDVDAYTITSESGSLDESGFNGLADDGDPGWFPGLPPSQGANRISEANFDGSTLFDGPSADADFDKDGDVDGDDFLAWQGGFGTDTGATQEIGDADGDGDVDGDDFLTWQAEFSNPVGGDVFGIGAIFDTAGAMDLEFEFTLTTGQTLAGTVQYFASGFASASAVPEPGSLAVTSLLALIGLVASRRR